MAYKLIFLYYILSNRYTVLHILCVSYNTFSEDVKICYIHPLPMLEKNRNNKGKYD